MTTTPLTKEQRESVGLINIGTFLEYFDFYTYIHISVVLNEIFFPTSDPYTKSLLMALSFSMAYILRPIGSLIFGFLGDLWGRKVTIVITTLMMSVASFALGCMPTFAQIGWTASIAVLICRSIQGMSSAVEVIGARIYISEMMPPPKSYFYTALISVASDMGTIFALGMCSFLLFVRPEDGWRCVFFLGSGIAVVGSIARTKLKESPEFLEAIQQFGMKRNGHAVWSTFAKAKRNVISYFLIELKTPIFFFIIFMQMGELLAKTYGYSSRDIIYHNFLLALVSSLSYLLMAILTRYIYPLKLIRITGLMLLMYSGLFPILLSHIEGPSTLFWLQVLPCTLNITGVGAAIFMRGFPVIGRYTLIGVSYSIARAIGAVTTSYACVWLANQFGGEGMAGLMFITVLLHLIGLSTFTPSLEDQTIANSMKRKTTPQYFR